MRRSVFFLSLNTGSRSESSSSRVQFLVNAKQALTRNSAEQSQDPQLIGEMLLLQCFGSSSEKLQAQPFIENATTQRQVSIRTNTVSWSKLANWTPASQSGLTHLLGYFATAENIQTSEINLLEGILMPKSFRLTLTRVEQKLG